MSSPDWLAEGKTVRDEDGERWVIRSVGVKQVEVGHTSLGSHRLQRDDLVEWVENGAWSTTS